MIVDCRHEEPDCPLLCSLPFHLCQTKVSVRPGLLEYLHQVQGSEESAQWYQMSTNLARLSFYWYGAGI